MFQKKHREVTGIVKKTKTGWKLDFDRLFELACGHKNFLEKVHEFFEQNSDKSWLYDIKVFEWQAKSILLDKPFPWLGIAFRMVSSVSYFACCADGAENSFVVEAHYNEDFIAQIAEML